MFFLRPIGVFLTVVTAVLALGCEAPATQPALPDPQQAQEWFGEGTQVALEGDVLVITGTIEADYLRRGGRIWARSGPYFYLFNIKVREFFTNHPGLAGVKATAVTEDGRVLATATVHRNGLNELRWQEALARASLAQTEGTDNPRLVERLIQFGEDHTEFEYAEGVR